MNAFSIPCLLTTRTQTCVVGSFCLYLLKLDRYLYNCFIMEKTRCHWIHSSNLS